MKLYTTQTAHPYGQNVSDQNSFTKHRKCILHPTERNESQRQRKSHRTKGRLNLGQQKFGFQLNLLGATLKATTDQLIVTTLNIFAAARIHWAGLSMIMTKNFVSIFGRISGRITHK